MGAPFFRGKGGVPPVLAAGSIHPSPRAGARSNLFPCARAPPAAIIGRACGAEMHCYNWPCSPQPGTELFFFAPARDPLNSGWLSPVARAGRRLAPQHGEQHGGISKSSMNVILQPCLVLLLWSTQCSWNFKYAYILGYDEQH